jgi:hypothetical protein
VPGFDLAGDFSASSPFFVFSCSIWIAAARREPSLQSGSSLRPDTVLPPPSSLSHAGVRCHPVVCSGFISVLPGSGECVQRWKPVCNQIACSLPSFFECLLVLSSQDLNSHRVAILWTGLLTEITCSYLDLVLFLTRLYKG